MRLEFLLEELSAEKALGALLPSILPTDVEYFLHSHNGKQDLLKQLPAKLRAYSKWLSDDARIVVLCDQHSQDCKQLKNAIINSAKAVGMDQRILARVVVTELECWFLGDLNAIEKAFPRIKSSRLSSKKKYRHPDCLSNASQELNRLFVRSGYKGGYQKVLGAQSIAEKMNVDTNRSHSFRVFKNGLAKLTSACRNME